MFARFTSPRLAGRLRPWAVCLLAAGAWAAGAAGARADSLDKQLFAKAPSIVEKLRQQGHKNVGVLRFRVQQGKQAEGTFNVGPLNGNMVTRLENALIMHVNPDDDHRALGIIRDTGRQAALKGAGNWYSNTAERKKLFDHSYPLAWGTRKVKADAFLTGKVKVAPDYRKTTVTIEAFSANAPALTPICEFTIDTDPALLADLGKSYALSRRSVREAFGKGAVLRDKIIREVKKRDDGEEKTDEEKKDEPTSSAGVMVGEIEFQLLSSGEPVAIKQGEDKKHQLESPEQEKEIIFTITNKSDKRLGVDVKLNGTSLLFRQDKPAAECQIWVVPPGKTYQLKGYYMEDTQDKNVVPLKVLVGEDAQTMKDQLGEKAGFIEISVFAEGAEGEEMEFSRNLRTKVGAKDRKDLDTLKNRLMRSALVKRKIETIKRGNKLVKREILVEDEEETKRQTALLKEVEFKRTTAPVAEAVIQILPKSSS